MWQCNEELDLPSQEFELAQYRICVALCDNVSNVLGQIAVMLYDIIK